MRCRRDGGAGARANAVGVAAQLCKRQPSSVAQRGAPVDAVRAVPGAALERRGVPCGGAAPCRADTRCGAAVERADDGTAGGHAAGPGRAATGDPRRDTVSGGRCVLFGVVALCWGDGVVRWCMACVWWLV